VTRQRDTGSADREPSVLINALTLVDGGGLTYILNLLRELGEHPRGFRFTVLVPEGRLSAADAFGIEVRSLRLRGASRTWQLAWRVVWEQVSLPFLARQFDLLYCVADMAPLIGLTPTVVALRNLNIYDRRFYNSPRLALLRLLVPLGVRRVRRVVFPTRAAADEIRDQVSIPEHKIAVVHHGISPEVFENIPSLRSDSSYLFLPAALERHKNIGVLIESLRYVTNSKLELWIAGQPRTDPEYAAELHQQVQRLGLTGRVHFLGPVPYREILGYYRGAIALVFPSMLETFGHPLLEAMLAGTPIIASNIGTFREVAGDAALYFTPDNPRELARAVDVVISDEEARRRRVALGRERVALFSWRRSVDRLCEVFKDALAAEGGRPPSIPADTAAHAAQPQVRDPGGTEIR